VCVIELLSGNCDRWWSWSAFHEDCRLAMEIELAVDSEPYRLCPVSVHNDSSCFGWPESFMHARLSFLSI
jgi:hypothetical protein